LADKFLPPSSPFSTSDRSELRELRQSWLETHNHDQALSALNQLTSGNRGRPIVNKGSVRIEMGLLGALKKCQQGEWLNAITSGIPGKMVSAVVRFLLARILLFF
jgi:hypothetical protein